MPSHRPPAVSPKAIGTKPVCLIGNLNIDLIIRQVPSLPQWGQEVLGASHLKVSSGQGAYTAFALKKLGVPTTLIGTVGDDSDGHQILEDLRSSGVDTEACEMIPGGQTGITVAIVRSDGERAFVSNLGCGPQFSSENIARHQKKIDGAGVVGLVGLFNLPGLALPEAGHALSQARSAGKITMLDTGWDPGNWAPSTLAEFRTLLQGVTLFMPNWDEARAVSGRDSLEQAASALLDQGPEIVVIKNGKDGSYVRTRQESHALPALPTKVHDAVGAGDTFNAGFLAAFRRGRALDTCLAVGNAAASLYISRSANRYPTLQEVIAAGASYGLAPSEFQ